MREILMRLAGEIEGFETGVEAGRVAPNLTPNEIRRVLATRLDLTRATPLEPLLDTVMHLLAHGTVQVTHPAYYGLFNPSVTRAAVLADTLVALHNPQLATCHHGLAAVEMERWVLDFFMRAVGFDPQTALATFTSGGAEANHSAVVVALTHAEPDFVEGGLGAFSEPPRIYLSAEGHDSFCKAVQATGLGRRSLRVVPTDEALRLDVGALEAMVEADRAAGFRPLMVIGTAGTTAAGVIDPLAELAAVARRHGSWLHVDGAWGASAALSRRLRIHLAGIEEADSITWDAHKWLQAPMAAGMLLCRHPAAVRRAFTPASASYMPAPLKESPEPYHTSLQWSRRFTGLKVLMTVAALGREGLEAMVERMAAMGDLLRSRLVSAGWQVVNRTPLPLVCFTHPRIVAGEASCEEVARRVEAAGRAWISHASVGGGEVLRACITSHRTGPKHIDTLIDALEQALGS